MEEHFIAPEMLLTEGGCYQPLCPVEDEFVAGEIVNRWFHREQSRRLKGQHEIEMLRLDAELAELLFRMKQKLSRLGRGGQWSRWLKQQRISRSTADRLVAQYAEAHGLAAELRHRGMAEPLEGNVCLAANRAFKRLKNMLSTTRSRMIFLKALAYRFDIQVDMDIDGSVRLSTPPPANEDELSKFVPHVMQIDDNGRVTPVSYELREKNGATVCAVEPICS
jgi:hypothetical protein